MPKGQEPEDCTVVERKLVEGLCMGMAKTQVANYVGYKNTKSVDATLKRPRVAALMEMMQEEAREKFQISRDDCVRGFKSAIDDAKFAGDPMAQIAGWREIAKVLGHYAPEEKKFTLTTDQKAVKQQLETMSEAELLELTGVDYAIDGEFEVVDD